MYNFMETIEHIITMFIFTLKLMYDAEGSVTKKDT